MTHAFAGRPARAKPINRDDRLRLALARLHLVLAELTQGLVDVLDEMDGDRDLEPGDDDEPNIDAEADDDPAEDDDGI